MPLTAHSKVVRVAPCDDVFLKAAPELDLPNLGWNCGGEECLVSRWKLPKVQDLGGGAVLLLTSRAQASVIPELCGQGVIT